MSKHVRAKKHIYSNSYYQHQSSESLQSAELVVPILIELIQPSKVVDVGCGLGGWLSVFEKHGVREIWGFDGDWVDTNQLKINANRFRKTNLTDAFAAEERFDLVLSLEVAEHLPEETAPRFVETLVRLGPVIVFSAAIPQQGGTHHVNEQWPDYWIGLFEKHGYHVVDAIRPRIWDMDEVSFWYRQNMLVFVNKQEKRLLDRLEQRQRNGQSMPLRVVHPELWLANIRNQADWDVRDLFRLAPRAAVMTAKKLWRKLGARTNWKSHEG